MIASTFLIRVLVAQLFRDNVGIQLNEHVEEHPWPHPFGIGHHGTTSETIPNLSTMKPAWNWTFAKGRFSNILAGGPVIDRLGNFYVVSPNVVHKISPDGREVWRHISEPINNMVTLFEDTVLGSTQTGKAFALSMETGHVRWKTKLGNDAGGDSGYPAQHDGVFVVGAGASQNPTGEKGGNSRVFGLDGRRGEKLWEFAPHMPVWNFSPLFPDDDTTVFMDLVGNIYKLYLKTGLLIWKTLAPITDQTTYSDGGAILGPDFVYTCSNINNGHGSEGTKGALRAYDLSDGKRQWERILPAPCNSYPAVGKLGDSDSLSVVVTPGAFMGSPTIHGGIMAFDAVTGKPQWQFQCPIWKGVTAKNDMVGKPCIPAHWSAPIITANRKVMAERIDGLLYAVEDTLLGHHETPTILATTDIDYKTTLGVKAETFDAQRSSLHGALAFAPGIMAFASCDSLFVFKYQH